MTEIAFYHLTRSTMTEVLPALLGRTLNARKRAVIRCQDTTQVEAIDTALWDVEPPLWLPHGRQDDPEEQPIWITCKDENPNSASYLFLLGDAQTEDFNLFERVFLLFDGRETSHVERAHHLRRRMRERGHTVSYWEQKGRSWTQAPDA